MIAKQCLCGRTLNSQDWRTWGLQVYEVDHPVGSPRKAQGQNGDGSDGSLWEKPALNLESEDISVPNHNSKSNCFQICISRRLHLLGQTWLQLVISGVMVDWSLSGVIVPILIIITYLTMKP